MKKWLIAGAACLSIAFIHTAGVSAASNIVNPKETYTYDRMTKDIKELASEYPEIIHYKSIGKTPYGREQWAVSLGNGESTVFFNGSHHAREWLTSTLNMYMIEQYAKAYESGSKFEGYDVRTVLSESTIWFVPMVNPDGVTLQQYGLSAFPKLVWSNLIKMNEGSRNFKRWKANAQGIDLNRQYPALWSGIKFPAKAPRWMNYKGTKPLQTRENQSMVKFTYAINPEIAVSYHTAGHILYWNFNTKPSNLARDKKLANTFSAITGYSQVKPAPNPSGGGYTDWFITTFGRPAFTPEIGIKEGETNLSVSVFDSEWKLNKKIGLWIADEGYRLWLKKNQAKQAVQEFHKDITISELKQLFNSNNFISGTVGTIRPQTLTATAKSGNWYKVKTDQGEKWLYDKNAVVREPAETTMPTGDPVDVDLTLTLGVETEVYSEPAAKEAKATITLTEVHAIQQWGSWYKINTPIGDLWIYQSPSK
ncbi:gamma-D-glutamyl-meso-diaminopimelate peptidase [Paenibacillus zeisoli]|uniref:Gamma-D-glutamyl-meso-diaminopimelate peptidase n=1 Tax=Paenibacillus zeisoli TaxID=2496267 RepID=A0A433XPS9_9BACL|nr:M14 family zinc carboxypeptidase [Paenibacillus zeisoli]RUT35998.1 gamma-D-glutamyl-meso-diaminopimelate peptidase [Paenibacillus zeisoli]